MAQTSCVVGNARVAVPTSTGNQDITVSGLGGLTPKAAVLYFTAGAITNGTDAAHTQMSVGMTDGTNHWCISTTDEDGITLGTTDVAVVTSKISSIIVRGLVPGQNTDESQATFVSFIADGIRINWGDAPPEAAFLHVVFYAGDDVKAFIGYTFGPTATNTVDVTGVGFKPDLIMHGSVRTADMGSSFNNAMGFTYGFVAHSSEEGATQGVFTHWSGESGATILNSRFSQSDGILGMGNSANDFVGNFNTFDSDGFSITHTAGGSMATTEFAYLAVNLGPRCRATVRGDTNPSGTPPLTRKVTTGFKPQAVVSLATGLVSVDSDDFTDRAGGYGFGCTTGVGSGWAFRQVGDDNQSTTTDFVQNSTNNGCVTIDTIGDTPSVAGLQSFDGDGFTLNWTDLGADDRRYLFLAIQAVPKEVIIGTVRAAANTSTGTQTFTDPALGGRIPKAAMFYFTAAAVTEDTAAADLQFSIGACDGTNQWVTCWTDRDNAATSDCSVGNRTTACIFSLIPGSTSTDGEADFDAFVADGVRVDWTNAPAAAGFVHVVLFAGDDIEAHARVRQGDLNGVETDVAQPGFEPDLVLYQLAEGILGGNVKSDDVSLCFGAATFDGTTIQQTCTNARSLHNSATTASMTMIDTVNGIQMKGVDGTPNIEGDFQNFDLDGFSFTANVGSLAATGLFYLALRLGPSVKSELSSFTTPPVSDKGYTFPGFRPQAVMTSNIRGASLNAPNSAGIGPESWTVGWGVSPTNRWSIGMQSMDSETSVSITNQYSTNAAIIGEKLGPTSQDIVGDLESLDPMGFTVDYTDVPPGPRATWALAIKNVPVADIKTAIIHATVPDATGTVSYTNAGLGGKTPKAAIIIASDAATGGGTYDDHFIQSIGATSGPANEWCMWARDEHGVTTSSTSRGATNDSCLLLRKASDDTIELEANNNAFIADGITLDWTTVAAASLGFRVTIILFAGDDVEAHANNMQLSTQDTAVDVTDPGFEPDAVLGAFYGSSAAFDSSEADVFNSHGWAVNPGGDDSALQHSIGFFSDDGDASADCALRAYNDRIAAVQDSSGNTAPEDFGVELSNFDSSGFTATGRAGATDSMRFLYLALKFTGSPAPSFFIGNDTIPTSTGTKSYVTNHKPQLVQWQQCLEPVDSGGRSGPEANAIGYSMFTPNDQGAYVWIAQDASAIMDTANAFSAAAAMLLSDDDGTDDAVGVFVSMDDTGFTIDHTDINNRANQAALILSLELSILVEAVGRRIFLIT